jgi:hypothetical protein
VGFGGGDRGAEIILARREAGGREVALRAGGARSEVLGRGRRGQAQQKSE